MRTLAKIVGAIVVCLVLALVVLRITGFNPIGNTPGPGNYPGLWLSGTVVKTPVTDWSFVTQYKTDKLETRTWYGIPHSVTTGFIFSNGQLYIANSSPRSGCSPLSGDAGGSARRLCLSQSGFILPAHTGLRRPRHSRTPP